uniref:Uncharacterized protein n=1 Tax=Anopheles coluzzii TaxID=1518534 RepID=A0A8W7PES8_ANOCL
MVTTEVDSSVNSASSVPLSSTTENVSFGKVIAVASIWFQVISGRLSRFASCICLMTTGDMSMLVIFLRGKGEWWSSWVHSSGYSPYHSNACLPRLRKKLFQYSVEPKSAVLLGSRFIAVRRDREPRIRSKEDSYSFAHIDRTLPIAIAQLVVDPFLEQIVDVDVLKLSRQMERSIAPRVSMI